VDIFDRLIGSLHGLPDVRATRPSTVTTVLPLLGNSQTFVVQTYRQRDAGDTIFLQMVDAEGRARIVIPPRVADAIARQRVSLTKASRRAAGIAVAEDRMARGEQPAFLRRRDEEAR
jgi:hypothetical protein